MRRNTSQDRVGGDDVAEGAAAAENGMLGPASSRRPKQGRLSPRSKASMYALGFLAVLVCTWQGGIASMLAMRKNEGAQSTVSKWHQAEGAQSNLLNAANEFRLEKKNKTPAAIVKNLLEFEVQLSEMPLRPNRRGSFKVLVHPEWAPLGSERLLELFKLGFYDQTRFFRVVKNGLVQWGISGDPATSAKWLLKTIPDDPVIISNRRGTVSFATWGKDSRSTQLIVNLGDNAFLDKKGVSPVGEVIDGMNVLDSVFSGYGEKPDPDKIRTEGNAYLKARFPKLSYIDAKAKISTEAAHVL